jgi:hypothetical protein
MISGFVLRNLELPFAGVRKELWEALEFIVTFLESHGAVDVDTTFSERPN